MCLCGCGRGNDLFEEHLPLEGSFIWYTYDETGGKYYQMNNITQGEELLEELSEVTMEEAPEWSRDMVTYPIYGMDLCGGLAWSNGYCIMEDGTAYHFEYDFETISSEYEWSDIYNFEGTGLLPCIRELCRGEDGRKSWLMSPAKEPEAPEGISLAIKERTEEYIRVEITNHTTEKKSFGEDYSVQVFLDGVWYCIPGNWTVNAIAWTISPGTPFEDVYDLEKYGYLPPGRYRLEKSGMVAEFEVE